MREMFITFFYYYTYFPALGRERDELLALLDIKERAKYKDCHSRSQQEEYDLFSTTEVCRLCEIYINSICVMP